MLVSAPYQYWHGSRGQRWEAALSPGLVRRFTLLPYLSVAIAYALLMIVARDQWGEPLGGLILGAIALTGLVVARQVAALRENAALFAEHTARAKRASRLAELSRLVTESLDVGRIQQFVTQA